MNKTVFGVLVGGGLGLIDGLSAWMSLEARPMMTLIIIGSTIKGVLTGAAAGFVARRWGSLLLAIAAGLGVGFVLSTLAALGQPGHYWEIVLPGMLVGLLTGVITQRYPRAPQTPPRSQVSGMIILTMLTVAATLSASTQTPKPADPLASLEPLIGRWEGTSEGEAGKGSGHREYTRILGTRFVQLHNRNVYPPQEKNPNGETHEDIGIFSFDNARKRIVLRQFHVEGFVNEYVQDSSSGEGTLVFTTEAIENIPAGWRARETYRFLSADEFEEVFELAAPNKDFVVYSRSRLRRVR